MENQKNTEQEEKAFKKAEAIGQIKTMPKVKEVIPEAPLEQSEAIIDSPDKFQFAIGNAQMEGLDAIEVTEKLFKHLARNSKTKYLTYGKPGIKVFIEGTREEIEAEESMSAEAYHDLLGKRRAANAPR